MPTTCHIRPLSLPAPETVPALLPEFDPRVDGTVAPAGGDR